MTFSKKATFRQTLLAGALLLTSAGLSYADYNVGSAAFNAGNYTRAYEEFKQSADAGNSLAQYMVGRLYAEGRGVGVDKVAAYMWYDLSAGNGNSRAIAARDSLAAQLDSNQIDRAQDLAAEWRANRQVYGAAPAAQVPATVGTPVRQAYSLRNVQVALANLGYAVGSPDGVIGPKSRAAIRAYQVDSKLPVSGEPSRALHEKLQASLAQRGGPTTPVAQAKPAIGSGVISEAQTELRRRGYAINAITGTANAETVAAVRAYQADARLPVTGEINDALLQQLRVASADSGAIYRAQVKQVQAALNAAGYNAGPADGALGPKSRAAISRYQSNNNLAATGEVNAELLASLDIEGDDPSSDSVANATMIRQTKEELQDHGYFVENLSGTLDLATQEAIRAYQRDSGLAVTGAATAGLLAHLRQADDSENTGTQLTLDIESQLQRHGYAVGTVDGVVDTDTRRAIRAYQADVGLAVTGDASTPLLAHLRSSNVTSQPASVIAETQYLLIRLGYLDAESDGVMNAKSTSAIRRYQNDRGLVITGWPSTELLAKLRTEPIVEPGAGNY